MVRMKREKRGVAGEMVRMKRDIVVERCEGSGFIYHRC